MPLCDHLRDPFDYDFSDCIIRCFSLSLLFIVSFTLCLSATMLHGMLSDWVSIGVGQCQSSTGASVGHNSFDGIESWCLDVIVVLTHGAA